VTLQEGVIMAVEISWDDAQHTILRVVLQDWGWDDLAHDEAIEARRRMLDAAPQPVTMLIILRDTPRNLLGMLPHMSQSPGFSHPNVQRVIIVADQNIIKVAADVFRRVYGQASRRMLVVGSLAEAYQVIAAGQPEQEE